MTTCQSTGTQACSEKGVARIFSPPSDAFAEMQVESMSSFGPSVRHSIRHSSATSRMRCLLFFLLRCRA